MALTLERSPSVFCYVIVIQIIHFSHSYICAAVKGALEIFLHLYHIVASTLTQFFLYSIKFLTFLINYDVTTAEIRTAVLRLFM